MRRKAIPLIAATLVAAMVPLGLSQPAGAEPPSLGSNSTTRPVDEHVITLITGDVLTVSSYPDGREAVTAEPPEGFAPATIHITTHGGETYVVPDRAEALLAADRLDPELFNITDLIADGYDDAHSDAIRLIATYPESNGLAPNAEPVPDGATRTASIPAIDAAALTVDKDDTSTLWSSLTDQPTTRLAGGAVEKLWLDRMMRATLDVSVPRTGAPEAWAEGYDGSGVKVAVLDSGIDPNHPDVAGQIAAIKNFTTTPDAIDHAGHGTHVAATIAGTGDASDGLRPGMAPGADLYIGKVLNDEGKAPTAWIIHGIQWAVAQDVDIISMSLGGDPTDGHDPFSRYINMITETEDILFVIAAGNAGEYGEYTVSAPGTADLALTVGAVDKTGVLADFSSRGPRMGDDAIKPEITAPGVDIVAARADGTSAGHPVNDLYTSLSGTSMATPHVAGAAALLKQRHPDWGPERLKASLTSTARPADYSVYEQGTGELDVARAVRQPVYANPGTLSLPSLAEKDDPVTENVTLVNDGDTPVDVDVELDAHGPDGSPAPDGLFTLPTGTTTVPAGGSVDIPVTVTAAGVEPGRYTGYLTATGPDETILSVAVSEVRARNTYTLSADITTRDGEPPGDSRLSVLNLDTAEFFSQNITGDAHPSIDVPDGRYSVWAYLGDAAPNEYAPAYVTVFTNPRVEVHGPATIPIDVTGAHRVDIDMPKDSQYRVLTFGYSRSLADGTPGLEDLYLTWDTIAGIYVKASGTPDVGSMMFFHHWQMIKPELSARLRHGGGDLRMRYAGGSDRFEGDRSYDVVDAGTASASDLDGRDLSGKLALIEHDPNRRVEDQIQSVVDAGADAVAIASGYEGNIVGYVGHDIPSFAISAESAATIRDHLDRHHGDTEIRLHSTPSWTSPYSYDVARSTDHLPADVSYWVRERDMARINAVYHSASEDLRGYTSRAYWPPNMAYSADHPDQLHGSLRQKQWLTASDDAQYRMSVTRVGPIGADLKGAFTTYRPGQRLTEHWFAPGGPAAPTQVTDFEADGGIPPYRDGDTLVITQPSYGDSDPSHWGFGGYGDTSEVTVYRNGEELGTDFQLRRAAIPVDPEPAEYRVELRANRSVESDGTNTSTISNWTFTSGHTDRREVLPMLHVDYDLNVDIHNQVSPLPLHWISLNPRYYGSTDPIPGARLRVEASYDEGETWRRQPILFGHHGRYMVLTYQPWSADTVSLRVRVTDRDGNSLEQTILRAYRVRR